MLLQQLQQWLQHPVPFKKQNWDEKGSHPQPHHSTALGIKPCPQQRSLSHLSSSFSTLHLQLGRENTGMKGRATLGESPRKETAKWSPATATGQQDQHLNQNSWLWQKGNGGGALCCVEVHPKPTPDKHHVWAGSMKGKSQPPRAAECSQTTPSLPSPKSSLWFHPPEVFTW